MATMPPELLVEQIDLCLTDSFRRASNRAEHIRLTRIQDLVDQLRAQLVSSSTSPD